MLVAVVLCYNVMQLATSGLLACAKECKGTALYKLTFEAEWTSASHPDFPFQPHFSSLVGCSHNASYMMWKPGMKATKGVKDVAEEGRK